MRVLCALGLRGGLELVRRALAVTGTTSELVLLHVVDTGPRGDLSHISGPWRRGPLSNPDRGPHLEAAEESSAQAVLAEAEAEAQRAGASAVTTQIERGRPEQVVVAVAAKIGADLILIGARENPDGHPRQGPPSVGHTARFVVDHAPCDVLLVRTIPRPGRQVV